MTYMNSKAQNTANITQYMPCMAPISPLREPLKSLGSNGIHDPRSNLLVYSIIKPRIESFIAPYIIPFEGAFTKAYVICSPLFCSFGPSCKAPGCSSSGPPPGSAPRLAQLGCCCGGHSKSRHIYLYIYICMLLFIYIYICIYVCIYIYMCTYVQA